MAEILPIRPWRYNNKLGGEIDSLTSPLFDVVSEKQRDKLYQNPLNSIHLSVPRHGDIAAAGVLLKDWKARGILRQDKLPGIYVYFQYFREAGSSRIFCRKGFICHIRVYDWADGVILRHENTMPGPVNDRIALLDETLLHASPTHGLYTDPDHKLEAFMDLAINNPIYETEDYQGVRDVMAVIHDAKIISEFVQTLAEMKIILADGHHRYEGSLKHFHRMRKTNPAHNDRQGYQFHLMYLTNTEADDLRILPTHRLVHGMPHLNEEDMMKNLSEFFTIKVVENVDTLNEVIVGKQWTFGLIFAGSAYKITLKPEVFPMLPWPFPDQIKRLDLTVMHYFIIEKILGIPGKHQRTSKLIDFERSFSECLKRVYNGDVQMAIITNEVTIEDVKSVTESGFTMPQKSTYFYPKVVGGFLFSSIRPEEFDSPTYAPF
ncbi:MAG: DUF1015 domain-containing protein [Chryseolinea sp.]